MLSDPEYLRKSFTAGCNRKLIFILLVHLLISLPYSLTDKAVLWIRIGFKADQDPAFYFNPDPDPGSQTNGPYGSRFGS